jgi:hypothetical protein
MKTIRLQQLIDSIVARAGIDPALPEAASKVHGRLSSGQATLVADYISSAIDDAWTFFDWPEIYLVESRTPLGAGFVEGGYTYEADYVDTISYFGRAIEGSAQDQPLWRIKRITTTESGDLINIDTANDVAWTQRLDVSYFEDSENDPASEIPYIYLANAGATPIGEITAVWDSDPSGLANKLRYTLTSDRILITDTAYASGPVFVEFALPQPEFALSDYDSNRIYQPGTVVYFAEKGDCYKALIESQGEPAGSSAWQKQSIPAFLADYIKEKVIGELLLAADKPDRAAYQFSRAEGVLLRKMDDAWLRKGEVRRYSASFQ